MTTAQRHSTRPDRRTRMMSDAIEHCREARWADAEAAFRSYVEYWPHDVVGVYNLGTILAARDKHDEAVSLLRMACDLARNEWRSRPHDNERRLTLMKCERHLGLTLKRSGDPWAAAIHAKTAFLLSNNPDLLVEVGDCYVDSNDTAKAIEHYEQAHARMPEWEWLKMRVGLLELVEGQWEAGWEKYEQRFDLRGADGSFSYGPFLSGFYGPEKRWKRGDDLAGKRLLLIGEQGLGDALMLIRFVRLINERWPTCEVSIVTQPGLVKLFEQSDLGLWHVHATIAAGTEIPNGEIPHDVNALIGSLPYLLGVTEPPRIDPYIKAIGCFYLYPRPRIGICYAGNPGHKDDTMRSCPVAELASLSEIPGVRLFNLTAADPIRKRSDGSTYDLSEGIETLGMIHPQLTGDMAETASILMEMDHVVSVDTAILHLAGALGIPAHGLLSYRPDWRWGLTNSDTPWYPSVTLHRQSKPGDWKSAVASLMRALTIKDEAKE